MNKTEMAMKLAKKTGLSATQEEDIRRIVEDSFERISTILDEAFSHPEKDIDWGPVKTQIDEIYQEAAGLIGPMVTEEQGEKLAEYFRW